VNIWNLKKHWHDNQGQIEENDVELITGAIKSSPLENKDRLALYGIK